MINDPNFLAESGFTAAYTDPHSGAVYPQAWIQIQEIDYIPNVSCHVVANVYVDLAAYQDGMSPVCSNIMPLVSYNSDDWNTYFDVSVMTQAGHDIQAQSLSYLQEYVQKNR